jgi:hypothetical protein
MILSFGYKEGVECVQSMVLTFGYREEVECTREMHYPSGKGRDENVPFTVLNGCKWQLHLKDASVAVLMSAAEELTSSGSGCYLIGKMASPSRHDPGKAGKFLLSMHILINHEPIESS